MTNTSYKIIIILVIVFNIIGGRVFYIQWQADIHQKNLCQHQKNLYQERYNELQQRYEKLQNKVDNFFGEYKRMRRYFK